MANESSSSKSKSGGADQRRARRVIINAPTLIESIGQPDISLHANLQAVYERVSPDMTTLGQTYPGVVRDLSTNGAFILGDALPLLARVAFTFQLAGFGKVEALGWTLWRRDKDCEVPTSSGATVTLPKGFGVLFEAIPLDARLAIHKLVDHAG